MMSQRLTPATRPRSRRRRGVVINQSKYLATKSCLQSGAMTQPPPEAIEKYAMEAIPVTNVAGNKTLPEALLLAALIPISNVMQAKTMKTNSRRAFPKEEAISTVLHPWTSSLAPSPTSMVVICMAGQQRPCTYADISPTCDAIPRLFV